MVTLWHKEHKKAGSKPARPTRGQLNPSPPKGSSKMNISFTVQVTLTLVEMTWFICAMLATPPTVGPFALTYSCHTYWGN